MKQKEYLYLTLEISILSHYVVHLKILPDAVYGKILYSNHRAHEVGAPIYVGVNRPAAFKPMEPLVAEAYRYVEELEKDKKEKEEEESCEN